MRTNGKPVDNQAKVSANYYKFDTNKTLIIRHRQSCAKPVVNKHRHAHLRQVIAMGFFLLNCVYRICTSIPRLVGKATKRIAR